MKKILCALLLCFLAFSPAASAKKTSERWLLLQEGDAATTYLDRATIEKETTSDKTVYKAWLKCQYGKEKVTDAQSVGKRKEPYSFLVHVGYDHENRKYIFWQVITCDAEGKAIDDTGRSREIWDDVPPGSRIENWLVFIANYYEAVHEAVQNKKRQIQGTGSGGQGKQGARRAFADGRGPVWRGRGQ
ncbi:MAG: hypothetical protein LBO03_01935 [Acidaminococcales bacterium]|nr:hypothetical protein [Acidaminococcales bacterium]